VLGDRCMKRFFGMGELLGIVLNALILSDIWPYIQAICSIEDIVVLLFNLHLCNKVWKHVIVKLV
jgi:hypothetical protein